MLNASKWMHHPDMVVIYSDEKLFPVTRAFDHQNDRVLAKDAATIDPHLRNVYRTQGAASVMVWGAVASNGKNSPFFQVPGSIQVNQYVYLNLMKTKVAKRIEDEFNAVCNAGARLISRTFGERLLGFRLHQASTPWTWQCRG